MKNNVKQLSMNFFQNLCRKTANMAKDKCFAPSVLRSSVALLQNLNNQTKIMKKGNIKFVDL